MIGVSQVGITKREIEGFNVFIKNTRMVDLPLIGIKYT